MILHGWMDGWAEIMTGSFVVVHLWSFIYGRSAVDALVRTACKHSVLFFSLRLIYLVQEVLDSRAMIL